MKPVIYFSGGSGLCTVDFRSSSVYRRRPESSQSIFIITMAVSQYLRSMLTRRSRRLNRRTILRLSLALRDQISNINQRFSVIFSVLLYLVYIWSKLHPKRSVTLLVAIFGKSDRRSVAQCVSHCVRMSYIHIKAFLRNS